MPRACAIFSSPSFSSFAEMAALANATSCDACRPGRATRACVADAPPGFVADHHREQQIATGRACTFTEREAGRGQRSAEVRNVAHVAVVGGGGVARGRVDACGEHGRELGAVEPDGALRLAALILERDRVECAPSPSRFPRRRSPACSRESSWRARRRAGADRRTRSRSRTVSARASRRPRAQEGRCSLERVRVRPKSPANQAPARRQRRARL